MLASDEDVAHVQYVETQYNLFDATPLHAAAFDGAAVKELSRPLNAVSNQTLDRFKSCSAKLGARSTFCTSFVLGVLALQ